MPTSEQSSSASVAEWTAYDAEQEKEAMKFNIWPLDEFNALLLNSVRPRNYDSKQNKIDLEVFDLVVIGSGPGGLMCSRLAAKQGAKSVLISGRLAGGDCLNVGCIPSKALIRCARAAAEVRRASRFGITISSDDTKIDFSSVMTIVRKLRGTMSAVDGHASTTATGAQVFQGMGVFTGKDTIMINNATTIKFKKAVIGTGGRPLIPDDIPGLRGAPYTTNDTLFNLQTLPPRMVILGAGAVALEMGQTFARLGTDVTMIQRMEGGLFASKNGDEDSANILKKAIEEDGVAFLTGATVKLVETLKSVDKKKGGFPLMEVTVCLNNDRTEQKLTCDCLLVATGRVPNVEDLGLDEAGVKYNDTPNGGVLVDDYARSISNPNVYAFGYCAANTPNLTHMSVEMAKVVVQNSLFNDEWKLSNLVVPAVIYTEPEYATVGLAGVKAAAKAGMEVDVYAASFEQNDRAILEGDEGRGLVKVLVKKGTEEIVGATIVAPRAGEMINEVTLAMKHDIGLTGIGRNIHPFPSTGEAVMACGFQLVNSKMKRLDS